MQLITFRVAEETYAFALEAVDEVASAAAVRAAADLPDPFAGEAGTRGETVPVIDLRRRLGLGAASGEGARRVLFTRTAAGTVGALVDEVHGVRDVARAAIDPPPAYFEHAAPLLRGLARVDGGLVILLEAEALLSAEGREVLERRGAAEA